MTHIPTIKRGLRDLKPDKRDFSYNKAFGAIAKLPTTDFMVATPIEIKNQYETDLCTSFSACLLSEFQENVKLSPEYQFAKTKELEGNYMKWGADLRTTMKSLVKFGSLEYDRAKYNLDNKDRNFVANWKNWDIFDDLMALAHKKRSYFKIDESGYNDLFDALRGALWQNKEWKRGILTGAMWKTSWTGAIGGIIPHNYGNGGFGHAFVLAGQRIIENIPYLVAVLSNGTEIGHNGYFYFPREVVNKELTFGNFMVTDMTPEDAIKVCWTWWQKLMDIIKQYTKL